MWQDDYFAVSVSEFILPKVIAYIENQEIHHQNKSFDEEVKQFQKNYGFLINKNRMLSLNFQPFPELKTQRLLLRQVLPTDVEAIMKIRGNEEAMRYIPRPRAKTTEDALAVVKMLTDGINEGKSINWAISNIENPSEIYGIMGYVNFYPDLSKAEIGYMLHPDYWGKGYVPEGILEVEKFGFEQINLLSIEAKIDPRNENSRKILSRNNYQFDKLVQKEMVFQEEKLDSEYYIKHRL